MKICRTRNLLFRQSRFFCSNPIQPQETSTKKSFDPEILKQNILKNEQQTQADQTSQIKNFNPETLNESLQKNLKNQEQTEEQPSTTPQTAEEKEDSIANEIRKIDTELLKESIKRNEVEEFDRSDKVIMEKINDVGSLDILPGHEYLINGFNDKYFNIGSVAVFGPVVVFQDSFFMWRVKDVFDITIDSLSILDVYSPRPSLLIVGTGHRRRDIDDEVIEHFSQVGISIEAYSTADASSTLNFLLQEGRNVAGALIPVGDKYNDEFRRE
jgi:uncharacterized protein